MNDSPGWTSPGSSPAGSPGGDQPGAQWSKEQPPPAVPPQPGPPAGPYPGTPQQGGPYGGGHGGGHHGVPGGPSWGPPPAPKPGVIPLRPIGLGEILDGAVTTMRTYWRPVLGISLVVAAVTQTVVVLLNIFLLNDITTASLNADPITMGGEEYTSLMGQSMLASFVLLLVGVIGHATATALLTPVTSQAVLGRPATVRQAWQSSRPQALRLLGLVLLIPLAVAVVFVACLLPGILVGLGGSAVGGGLLIFFGIFPAVALSAWIYIRWALSSPALILEKQPVLRSMTRSAKLVQGSWWRIFGILALTNLITAFVSFVIAVPFELVGMSMSGMSLGSFLGGGTAEFGPLYYVFTGIGGMFATTVTLPITAGVTVLLYIDRRIRREALDLELARASGSAPGAGS
ncbi:hypothetical protein [Streptomyces abyssomicinicus]|uniref:hypothetical protein n=1 Tax=Streptomyces abyssomicinicus TaxID=574929 RepID=UPI00124F7FCE|nr:hypothetical protein [Streptomyces abyssomicinicus]